MIATGSDAEALVNHVVQRDVFLRLFLVRLKWTSWRVVVLMSLLVGISFFVVGGIASAAYTGLGHRLDSPVNLLFEIQWVLFFSPLVWSAYIWQARSAPRMIIRLASNGIFDVPTSANYRLALKQSRSIFELMQRRSIYLLGLIMVALFWWDGLTHTWPLQFRVSQEFWFETKWYLPVYIATFSIGLFVLMVFAIRQVFFVFSLFRLFAKIYVIVKPLDPDESGGLGAIGEFAKASLLLALGLGLIVVFYGLYMLGLGNNLLQRVNMLVFFGLYIVLVPFCLLAPVFSARGVMIRARKSALDPIAREFQEVLAKSSILPAEAAPMLKEVDEQLAQLQCHRQIIMDTFPTLPISMSSLRRFSLTATLPLVSGLLSFVLQFVK